MSGPGAAATGGAGGLGTDPAWPAIFPAIDIRGGKVVRLEKGRLEAETVYGDDPVAWARRWHQEGAEWIHTVDLGGAIEGSDSMETVLAIARAVPIPVQAGGGIRDGDRIARLLDGGVRRVMLGTKAFTDPRFLEEAVIRHGPDRIVLAMDVQDGKVKVRGWLAESGLDLEGGLALARKAGVRHILLTAIDRDGTLRGPDMDMIRTALAGSPGGVIAAGGIGTLDHIRALLDLGHPCLEGVVVGKALYERTVALPRAAALSKEHQAMQGQRSGPDPAPSGLDPLLDGLKYDANGLIPAVVQDAKDGQVLMVAWMDREALRRTITGGLTCFFSRSRKEYWVKGLTSGNTQKVVRIALDCDQDCLLVVVEQQGKGVACHTGMRSCFYRQIRPDGSLPDLDTSRPIY